MALRRSKELGQCGLSNIGLRAKKAYHFHLIPCQAVPPVIFPVSWRYELTAFCNHVSDVIGWGSKPKVCRSNAPPIVTVMEHPQTISDRPAMKNPASDMRTDRTFTSRTGPNHAIPRTGLVRLPNPARAQFGTVCRYWTILVHLRPKAMWEGCGKALRGQILGSNLDHLRLLPRWVYWTREAFSF